MPFLIYKKVIIYMPFVQKYKSGGGTRDLKKESNEYVYETPKEPEVKQEQVDNTPKTSTIVETNKPITDDKLTINGVELSKKKLIPYLEKKSFSATGINRLAWDKTLDALKKVSTYNTSDSLDVDYGNNVKFDLDGLNFLAGKELDFVNKKAFEGTLLAHNDGGVPNIILTVPELSAYYFGQLVYFFEKACGISGYLLNINPFDQPGVEAYKKNMFALLGKPGYEDMKAELEKRL